MKPLKIVACAALLLGLAACTPEAAEEQGSVTSWCDEHGNRIYVRGVSGDYSAPLFVLGADPTCKTEQGR